ncbi:hypothetical protein PsYK624_134260 [Phanerochaete sordida]|uniref:DEAD/DEAH box helicase domain-containing protein n=1 Tax=Phanerochaete sordida TaxID=48140 RepID=A0A9P3LJE0_9APHY|nr:hypothetical protein PsYK624_134260 [Phanerochaete sordida]
MDADEKLKVQVPKTATLVLGSTVQPKRIIDLEAMTFSLMSNKKRKLPKGSFNRARKVYEDIHVPAPKELTVNAIQYVPITELPPWAQEGFKGIKTLNRVQNKLFPIAFGTDEPVLLCAPTGAGETNVGMLIIPNELAKYHDEEMGQFDLDAGWHREGLETPRGRDDGLRVHRQHRGDAGRGRVDVPTSFCGDARSSARPSTQCLRA